MLTCPHDRVAIVGDTCTICEGRFIQNGWLVERLEMKGLTYADVPFEVIEETELPCPMCATPMTRDRLCGWTVERCAQHGVWFDKDEVDDIKGRISSSPSPSRLAEELGSSRGVGDVALAVAAGTGKVVVTVVIELITLPFTILSEL